VHHYGVNGHVRKTQRLVQYSFSLSVSFRINWGRTLASMLQNKSIMVKPHYLDVWLPAHDDDETMVEKVVCNNITSYA
jgi:hypothetical protein